MRSIEKPTASKSKTEDLQIGTNPDRKIVNPTDDSITASKIHHRYIRIVTDQHRQSWGSENYNLETQDWSRSTLMHLTTKSWISSFAHPKITDEEKKLSCSLLEYVPLSEIVVVGRRLVFSARIFWRIDQRVWVSDRWNEGWKVLCVKGSLVLMWGTILRGEEGVKFFRL